MENEMAVKKYIRYGSAFSCLFNSTLLLLGGFYLAVNEFFPAIAQKLSIGSDLTTTDFPPIDVIFLSFNFLFELLLLGMYGVFPALFGCAGLLRNIFDRLFTLKKADTDEAFKLIVKSNDFDFVMAIVCILFTFGFTSFGIFYKIFTSVNAVMLVVSIVILIKRPKLKKPEADEHESDEDETAEEE